MEKFIYGVVVERVEGKDRPVLQRRLVVKETAKTYFLERCWGFLGYRTLIPKDGGFMDRNLKFTALDAWDYYLAKCDTMRNHLRDQADQLTTFQRIALQERQDLAEGLGE